MTFSIPQIIQNVFGLSGFKLPTNPDSPSIIYNVPEIELQQAQVYTAIGTPIYDLVKFLGGTVKSTSQNYQGLDLLDAPLIAVSRKKVIIQTAIAGRDGSVKELISNGDWNVRIRGILASHDSPVYPYADVEALNRLVNVPAALEIESRLLNMFGINSLVIESFEFPDSNGFTNIQPYILNCISDYAPEVRIKSGI